MQCALGLAHLARRSAASCGKPRVLACVGVCLCACDSACVLAAGAWRSYRALDSFAVLRLRSFIVLLIALHGPR
jgi:hypothetical protein